jgi:hypothetical protein
VWCWRGLCSCARLPIDTLEFIDPIFDSEHSFERTFFIVGVRHRIRCDGEECEQGNEFDHNAVLPCVILYIVGYGLLSKMNIFDIFIDGAKYTVVGLWWLRL